MARVQTRIKDKTTSKSKKPVREYTKGKPPGENWRELKFKNKNEGAPKKKK